MEQPCAFVETIQSDRAVSCDVTIDTSAFINIRNLGRVDEFVRRLRADDARLIIACPMLEEILGQDHVERAWEHVSLISELVRSLDQDHVGFGLVEGKVFELPDWPE